MLLMNLCATKLHVGYSLFRVMPSGALFGWVGLMSIWVLQTSLRAMLESDLWQSRFSPNSRYCELKRRSFPLRRLAPCPSLNIITFPFIAYTMSSNTKPQMRVTTKLLKWPGSLKMTKQVPSVLFQRFWLMARCPDLAFRLTLLRRASSYRQLPYERIHMKYLNVLLPPSKSCSTYTQWTRNFRHSHCLYSLTCARLSSRKGYLARSKHLVGCTGITWTVLRPLSLGLSSFRSAITRRFIPDEPHEDHELQRRSSESVLVSTTLTTHTDDDTGGKEVLCDKRISAIRENNNSFHTVLYSSGTLSNKYLEMFGSICIPQSLVEKKCTNLVRKN